MGRMKSAIAAVTLGLLSLGTIAGSAGAQTAATAAAAPTAPVADGTYGVWRNPKGSVHLDIRPCGANACGYVVWASAEAQADSRKAGNGDLVGAQLLREFRQQRPGLWRGRVFVPDMNRTFSGSAELVAPDRLRAKGCLIGGFLCKSQVWTRVQG